MPAKMASIINMKGGVGKTTLTFNLARFLSERRNKRVLLIDLDPQANASIVSTEPEAYKEHCQTKKTVADIFINAFRTYGPVSFPAKIPEKLDEFIFPVYRNDQGGHFHLIPSELILSSVLKGMTLGPFDLDLLISQDVRERYDYILVDCAPTYSSLTTVAFNSTKAVLIPMIADSFGVHGTNLMKTILAEHKYDFGFSPKIIGVVFTFWQQQANQVDHSTEIIAGWGSNSVFQSKISKNNWYRVANGKRETIWDSPTHQIYKTEFENFVLEFEARI